jgi:hypothetical protein
MIDIGINIRNPWHKGWSKTLFSKSYDTLLKHKFIELECYKDGHLLSFMLAWTIRQSHAGFDLEIGLLGYNFHFNVYDSRHWNEEAGRFYFYDSEGNES